jgi:hypothetical protein
MDATGSSESLIRMYKTIRHHILYDLLIVARQRLGRYVTAVTNTHATIEELLDTYFSMRSVSYQGKWAISSSQNFLFQNKESRLKKEGLNWDGKMEWDKMLKFWGKEAGKT